MCGDTYRVYVGRYTCCILRVQDDGDQFTFDGDLQPGGDTLHLDTMPDVAAASTASVGELHNLVRLGGSSDDREAFKAAEHVADYGRSL